MDKKSLLFVVMIAFLLTDIVVTLYTLLGAEWEIFEIKGDPAERFGDLHLGAIIMQIKCDKISNVSVHDLQLKIDIISSIILAMVGVSFTLAAISLSMYEYLTDNVKIPVCTSISIFAAGCFKAITVLYMVTQRWKHSTAVQLLHFGRAFYIYSGNLILSIVQFGVHYHGTKM